MQETAVAIDAVSFAYPGAETSALETVTLHVPSGSRLGILGPNGGGKSTLLKIILGQLVPQTGTVKVFGMSPRQATRKGLVGCVPQGLQIERGFPLSVKQVVLLAMSWRLSPFRAAPVHLAEKADGLLQLVGASAISGRPIGDLSGGQLQRVMIARSLAASPRLLVLDEPTVGIDASGQAQFAELLSNVHRQTGITMLIVSHDLRAIAAGCDRVACLSRRLHFHDAPTGLTPSVLAEVFAHEVAGLVGPLAGMHVHAHGPDELCPLVNSGPTDSASGSVTLTVSRTAPERGTTTRERPAP